MTHAHDLDAPHPHGRVRFGHNRTLHNLVERGPGTHGEGAHVSHESQLCRAGRLRAGTAAQNKNEDPAGRALKSQVAALPGGRATGGQLNKEKTEGFAEPAAGYVAARHARRTSHIRNRTCSGRSTGRCRIRRRRSAPPWGSTCAGNGAVGRARPGSRCRPPRSRTLMRDPTLGRPAGPQRHSLQPVLTCCTRQNPDTRCPCP